MKLTLNGVAVETAEVSMKNWLEKEGYFFPCAGKGLCGRCRIVSDSLPISEKDKRFLTMDELSGGVRLACDKLLSEGLNLSCAMQKKPKPKKLSDCDILAILGSQTIYMGILSEGELVDGVVLENDGAEVVATQKTKAIRSIIAHEAIEFFERFGTAKAGTIYIVATSEMRLALTGAVVVDYNEAILASVLDLPSDEVVFAPGKNAIDYLKNLDMPEKTLVERAVRFATDIRFRLKLLN